MKNLSYYQNHYYKLGKKAYRAVKLVYSLFVDETRREWMNDIPSSEEDIKKFKDKRKKRLEE